MPTVKKQSPISRPKSTSNSVIDRIKPIGMALDTHIRAMLYGQSGTGKTTVWGSFPGPILAIICSGGNKTGELRSLQTPEMQKKIKTVTLQSSSEIKELIDYQKETATFETIVLDHVSGLQDLVLKEILGIDELPAQKSWGLASQQQYGQCTQQCKEYLRAMLNLDCNSVIIGQERVNGGKDDGVDPEFIAPTVGVATTPSLAGWLNPACDYVLQTFKRPKMVQVKTMVAKKEVVTTKRGKGVEYCVRCEPHEVFMTKFRVPKGQAVPDVIVDPTYDKIMKVIQGKG